MKAMAASSIGRYEEAVRALAEYDRAVRLGLGVSLRNVTWHPPPAKPRSSRPKVPNVIVFGSDQGLVGQFNDVIARLAIETLPTLTGSAIVWAVGERIHARLADDGVKVKGLFHVPNDVSGIGALVGHLQRNVETRGVYEGGESLYVFHNRQCSGSVYEAAVQRILPLDREWREQMTAIRWPSNGAPELLAEPGLILRALLREYIFISLFQACAESLASENASRLAAMRRAEKNIDELKEGLTRRFHQARQTSIDEQLFDVVSGFEALN